MTILIAVDGPAGTGKSSVSRIVAKQLNYAYVDTGAIYRALAYLADKNNVDPKNVFDLIKLISKITSTFDEEKFLRIKVDDQILDKELRTEKISKLSSVISKHEKVRKALLPVQRDLLTKIKNGAIFEGRDIGTVVFKNSPLKIFITANVETRAKRRYEELIKKQEDLSFGEVLTAIKSRDERDSNRPNAPMQKAADAHLIDTSTMSLKEVTSQVLRLIEETLKAGS